MCCCFTDHLSVALVNILNSSNFFPTPDEEQPEPALLVDQKSQTIVGGAGEWGRRGGAGVPAAFPGPPQLLGTLHSSLRAYTRSGLPDERRIGPHEGEWPNGGHWILNTGVSTLPCPSSLRKFALSRNICRSVDHKKPYSHTSGAPIRRLQTKGFWLRI